MNLTADQILALAPDESSSKAAKGLVVPAKWFTLGADGSALWGECQGSGSKPYQVQVALDGPAFCCSCPSRKLPCKHGLALMLLRAQQPGAFRASSAPAWASEWLASRERRAARQEQQRQPDPSGAARLADPEASAMREAKRLEKMLAGAADLQRWLADRVQHGLANLVGAEAQIEGMAARMVDAQAPGLAYRVRQIRDIVGVGPDWPVRLLDHMGRTYLLLDALHGLDRLAPDTQRDLRTAAGWPVDQAELLADGVRASDTWQVLGLSCDENERLWERRVWLRGPSGRYALLLDFAHAGRLFDQSYIPGTSFQATLAYFPGAWSLRALVVGRGEVPDAAGNTTASTADSLEWLARAVAANPWQSPLPMLLSGTTPRVGKAGWQLDTAEGGHLPLALAEDDAWQLIALSGGAPVTVFGQWDGERLRPLSCWTHTLAWAERVGMA